MSLDYSSYAPVAYAAAMPPEQKSKQYERELRKLLTTIKNMKGLTTEVKQLKQIALAAENVFTTP